jgi:hypothetical protein
LQQKKQGVKMYYYGNKALVMTDDPGFRLDIEDFLETQYNLEVDMVENSLEVLGRFADIDHKYQLIILDEKVDGLSTASHVFRTIKENDDQICVLYRSAIKEIAGPFKERGPAIGGKRRSVFDDGIGDASLFLDNLDSRLDLASRRVDRINSLIYPVIRATDMEGIYESACAGLNKMFDVDYSLIAIMRLELKPVKLGNMVWDCPRYKETPMEFDIQGSDKLEKLVNYFNPLHIPDMENEPSFGEDLERVFGLKARSAYMVPMVFDGSCLGFIGMFTRKEPRIYSLVEQDIIHKLSDFTTISVVGVYAQTHLNIKIPKPPVGIENYHREPGRGV